MTANKHGTLTSLWASSTTALGNCTPMGAGAPWTSRKAYDAFQAAAELGNGDARRNLGRFKRNWFGKWVRK